jgi:hypothetical protein
METKVDVERVVDDGRKINQYVPGGTYGSEVARLWATVEGRHQRSRQSLWRRSTGRLTRPTTSGDC